MPSFASPKLGLSSCFLLLFACVAGDCQELMIDWYSVGNSDFHKAEGGTWGLSATAGQAEASLPTLHIGGEWQLQAGFWSLQTEGTDFVFTSGFEDSVSDSQTVQANQNKSD